jgi:hypothetical protein
METLIIFSNPQLGPNVRDNQITEDENRFQFKLTMNQFK